MQFILKAIVLYGQRPKIKLLSVLRGLSDRVGILGLGVVRIDANAIVSINSFVSHTTSVGMTLILVSFFLILIILATNWSHV